MTEHADDLARRAGYMMTVMGSQMSSYSLYFGVGLTVALWSLIIVPAWARAAQRRGGCWYLEGLLFICGPISTLILALYPKTAGDAPSGFFPVVNRGLIYVALVLVVIALVDAVRSPREHSGPLIAGIGFFYIALIFSCIGGARPLLPETYWVTPLAVLAFMIHGSYSYEWFLGVARWALRCILLFSFVALLNPEIGFNYEEVRTFAGYARMQGITPHPNSFAFVAVIALVIEVGTRSRPMWGLLSMAGILLAQSTTAYVMAAVALLIMSTRLVKTFRVAAGLGLFVFSCAALVTPVWAGTVLGELVPTTAGTLNGRTAIWQAVLFGFREHPIFGYGPTLLDEDYRQLYLPNFSAAAQAHSQWFQTLGGTGLVGVASLVVLGVVLLVFAIRAGEATKGLSLALFTTLVVRGLSETPLRPAGMSLGTFCLIVVMTLIAAAPRRVPIDERAISKPESPNYQESSNYQEKQVVEKSGQGPGNTSLSIPGV